MEKLIKPVWKVDKTLGYVYTISFNHPLANSQGKIYQHVYIACLSLGRLLESNEVVHHIDRNRANNDIDNLLVLDKAEHNRLHMLEDRGYQPKIKKDCRFCGKEYKSSVSENKIYCSYECSHSAARKFNISADDLHYLVWTFPTTHVSKMLGVSDTAIGKRCKSLNIEKPPRGYWAKKAAGKI